MKLSEHKKENLKLTAVLIGTTCLAFSPFVIYLKNQDKINKAKFDAQILNIYKKVNENNNCVCSNGVFVDSDKKEIVFVANKENAFGEIRYKLPVNSKDIKNKYSKIFAYADYQLITSTNDKAKTNTNLSYFEVTKLLKEIETLISSQKGVWNTLSSEAKSAYILALQTAIKNTKLSLQAQIDEIENTELPNCINAHQIQNVTLVKNLLNELKKIESSLNIKDNSLENC